MCVWVCVYVCIVCMWLCVNRDCVCRCGCGCRCVCVCVCTHGVYVYEGNVCVGACVWCRRQIYGTDTWQIYGVGGRHVMMTTHTIYWHAIYWGRSAMTTGKTDEMCRYMSWESMSWLCRSWRDDTSHRMYHVMRARGLIAYSWHRVSSRLAWQRLSRHVTLVWWHCLYWRLDSLLCVADEAEARVRSLIADTERMLAGLMSRWPTLYAVGTSTHSHTRTRTHIKWRKRTVKTRMGGVSFAWQSGKVLANWLSTARRNVLGRRNVFWRELNNRLRYYSTHYSGLPCCGHSVAEPSFYCRGASSNCLIVHQTCLMEDWRTATLIGNHSTYTVFQISGFQDMGTSLVQWDTLVVEIGQLWHQVPTIPCPPIWTTYRMKCQVSAMTRP